MVDIAKFFLEFTVDESCGKCTPCRVGTRRMLEILERITDGRGEDGDIEKLEELANTIKATALCGLGQTAPNPCFPPSAISAMNTRLTSMKSAALPAIAKSLPA